MPGWRLTPVASGEFTEMYQYNEVGQVTKKRLHLKRSFSGSFPTGDLDADYTYDNDGRMTSYGIPLAGDTYNSTFDSMGRRKELTKTGSSHSPVKDVLYGAGGQMTQVKYLNRTTTYHTETRTYNPLLQLTRITVPSQMDTDWLKGGCQ